jgi:hypothetical protein
LERAQDEAESAGNQLAAAEEYMCTLIDIIYSSGFAVNFLDAHTPAVTKVTGNEHITRELCASVCLKFNLVVVLDTRTVSVAGSSAVSLVLD